MVCAYSASHTTSSSSTPRASPSMRTASPNTAVPCAVIAGSSGSSMGRANPAGSSVVGRVVERGVGRLLDRDLVDAVAPRCQHHRQQLGPTGVDARAEDRRAAALARLREPPATVPLTVTGDERGGAHEVGAGLEDARHLVDVHPHRVVDHAVRLQREQRVDVVGGGDADRVESAELAHVRADLVVRPGVAADQLEAGVAHHRVDRLLPDVPRRPLHDSDAHGVVPLGFVTRLRGGARAPPRRAPAGRSAGPGATGSRGCT